MERFLNDKQQKTLRRTLAIILAAALVACVFFSVRYYHVHSQAQRILENCHIDAGQWANAAKWNPRAHLSLDEYEWAIEALEIPEVSSNLSGLAYSAEHHVLLGVINRPPTLVLLDVHGKALGTYRLSQTGDTKGVAYLGDNQFAVLSESKNAVHIFQMPTMHTTAPLDVHPSTLVPTRVIALDLPEHDNAGPEGIAYDAERDVLYVAKEHSPRGIYEFHGLRQNSGALQKVDRSAWLESMCFSTDLASIEFDPRLRHLILLSEESQKLVEITHEGEPVSYRKLRPSAWWHLPPPQPEGVAIDNAGNIYVVSEPNLFYKLRPRNLNHCNDG